MSYIEFVDVSKTYGSGETLVKANDGITFAIEQGEFVVVLGPSGAGKSTLLNILGGMDVPTEGDIYVDGVNIAGYSNQELTKFRRNNVGFVFQFYNLVPNLTAKENVELSTQISQNPADVDQVLNDVGLADRKGNFPAQLSGGEQQRVAIARALAKQPKLLLCDEPTGALDFETGKQVLALLADQCQKTGTTVIIITHNQAIAEMANRVISVNNGQVRDNSMNPYPKSVDEIVW